AHLGAEADASSGEDDAATGVVAREHHVVVQDSQHAHRLGTLLLLLIVERARRSGPVPVRAPSAGEGTRTGAPARCRKVPAQEQDHSVRESLLGRSAPGPGPGTGSGWMPFRALGSAPSGVARQRRAGLRLSAGR